jgi:hypothetical protein
MPRRRLLLSEPTAKLEDVIPGCRKKRLPGSPDLFDDRITPPLVTRSFVVHLLLP